MPKKLTKSQKYYRAHKKEQNERTRRYRREHKEYFQEYEKKRNRSPEEMRMVRRKSHIINREKDLAGFKKHYQENKEYHKNKNKEHYEKNKEKWKERRAEISKDWTLAKASKTIISSALYEAGIDVTIDRDMTTFQMFSIIESLGLDLEDCLESSAFKARYDRYADEYRQMKNNPQ